MKITLDLSKLLEEGKITPADAERLKTLARHETGSLGINILIGFGVIAVSAGVLFFLVAIFQESVVPVPVVGALMFALGLLIVRRYPDWDLLGQICLVVGALTFAGGLIYLDNGSLRSALAVTAIFAVAAVLARSSLMAALAVVSFAGCLGARTGYMHAMYSLSIQEPAVTIVLFTLLALALYLVSLRVAADYERIALSAARMSVVLVNFGFWIGSLWGDNLRLVRAVFFNDDTAKTARMGGAMIPDTVFVIGWALALLMVGIWGVRANRRWVVNVAAVFGAIHFYTQWFAYLGADPLSVMIGGILMLATAIALWRFNKRAPAQPAV